MSSHDEEIWFLKNFFDALPDFAFVGALENFSNGNGYGIDVYYTVIFPGDLDPDEEQFDGVKVHVIGDEIVMSYKTFYDYLKKVCESYVSRHPEDKEKVDELLEAYRKRWEIS